MRNVEHFPNLEQPGDYIIVQGDFPMPNGIKRLRSIVFNCFECNRPMSLYRNHVVDIDTLNVTPSIVCPYNTDKDNPKCSGHYYIVNGNKK